MLMFNTPENLLLFMSLLRKIMRLLKIIFTEETAPAVQPTVTIDPSKCMKEDVIDFLVQGHEQDERGRIRAHIKEQESKGIYEYSFSTSRWYFEVKNGQFKSSNDPEKMKINKI